MSKGVMECLGRVPYASLIALVLAWVGVAVFCSFMYQAVDYTLHQAKSIFEISLPWLDKIQITFIIVAVVMAFTALILMIIGALGTGETRRSVYKGWTARLGGRISCAIFLVITYILNICWLLIFALSSVLLFLYYVFDRFCIMTSSARTSDSSSVMCLDLDTFAPLLNGTTYARPQKMQICGRQLMQFCTTTNHAYPFYGLAFFGSAVVILGLIHFMTCLAANYAHIKDEIKYIELDEIHNEYKEFKLDERV